MRLEVKGNFNDRLIAIKSWKEGRNDGSFLLDELTDETALIRR